MKLLALLSGAAAVSPVEKVIEMLNGMQQTGTEEKASEEALFKKIEQTEKQNILKLGLQIDRQSDLLERYTAQQLAGISAAEQLEAEVVEIDNEHGADIREQKEKNKLRDEQHAVFLTTRKDLEESVDALDRAVLTVKAKDRKIETLDREKHIDCAVLYT